MTMTQAYYESKRQEYMGSGASPEVKAKAIEALDAKFLESSSAVIAKELMVEMAADPISSAD